MSYDENVLIKLRRDYSENESVMHLLNLVKSLKIELGKNNAYIEELESKNNALSVQVRDLKNNLKSFSKEAHENVIFKNQQVKIKSLKDKVKCLTKVRNDLMLKNINK